MKPKLCTYCREPLKPARLIVHSTEADRPSGEFHVDVCYLAACEWADVLNTYWKTVAAGN